MNANKLASFLAAIAMVACADADSDSIERNAAERRAEGYEITGQSLKLQIADGHAIEYQLGDRGELSISETGNEAEHTSLVETQNFSDAAEVYRALHPGAEVPGEIEEFNERMLAGSAYAEDYEPTDAPVSSDDIGFDGVEKHQTSDANHFINGHFGCFFGPNDYFTGCLTNRTGTRWATGSSRWAIFKVGVYRGSLVMKSASGNAGSVTTVNEGQFRYYVGRGGLKQDCSFLNGCSRHYATTTDHRLDILESANDGYHVSWRMHNLRHETGSCAEVSTTDAPKYAALACFDHYGNIGY